MKDRDCFLCVRLFIFTLITLFMTACSDDYHKVSFTTDDILPASSTIVVESNKLDDVPLIPNQTSKAFLEVIKLGGTAVKDVFLEVEMSPVDDISRTSVKATRLYFDKYMQSYLSVTAVGYDAEGKAGVLVECSSGGCAKMSLDLSNSPTMSFATIKTVDLAGFSAMVKTPEE